jgi:hypothetical protein
VFGLVEVREQAAKKEVKLLQRNNRNPKALFDED